MMQKNFFQRFPWLIPVVMGFIVMVVLGIIYHAKNKPISSQIINEAKVLSVDPVELNDINMLDNKMFDKKPLTDEEWQRYKSYATGSNLVFKRKTARHLIAAKGSKHEQEAHEIAKTLVTDGDPTTRANSLMSLRRFNDSSWRQIARKFLTDPDEAPRKMGETMLQQDGNK